MHPERAVTSAPTLGVPLSDASPHWLTTGKIVGDAAMVNRRNATNGDNSNSAPAMSYAEFKQELTTLGFLYVRETRGFLDLRRNKRKRFKRLVGIRDDSGRLIYRETIACLVASREP
jgi:hypothetical protein